MSQFFKVKSHFSIFVVVVAHLARFTVDVSKWNIFRLGGAAPWQSKIRDYGGHKMFYRSCLG